LPLAGPTPYRRKAERCSSGFSMPAIFSPHCSNQLADVLFHASHSSERPRFILCCPWISLRRTRTQTSVEPKTSRLQTPSNPTLRRCSARHLFISLYHSSSPFPPSEPMRQVLKGSRLVPIRTMQPQPSLMRLTTPPSAMPLPSRGRLVLHARLLNIEVRAPS